MKTNLPKYYLKSKNAKCFSTNLFAFYSYCIYFSQWRSKRG